MFRALRRKRTCLIVIALFLVWLFVFVFTFDKSSLTKDSEEDIYEDIPMNCNLTCLESTFKTQKRPDEFWIIEDFLISDYRKRTDNQQDDNSITLVTQTTSNHLHAMEMLSNAWKGPISVSVFMSGGDIESTLNEIFRYFYSVPKIRENTSFHLVILKQPPKVDADKNQNRPSVILDKSSDQQFINENKAGFRYPFNVLRNVALKQVERGYIFYTDIDMVPSTDLYDNFLHYISHIIEEERKTTAFVVAAFEARNDSYIPQVKNQLLKYLSDGNIRSYAIESCEICQSDTDYEKWKNLQTIHMSSYKIRRSTASYEPFYILHSSSYPSFDERFAGRGRNRQSQVKNTLSYFIPSNIALPYPMVITSWRVRQC